MGMSGHLHALLASSPWLEPLTPIWWEAWWAPDQRWRRKNSRPYPYWKSNPGCWNYSILRRSDSHIFVHRNRHVLMLWCRIRIHLERDPWTSSKSTSMYPSKISLSS